MTVLLLERIKDSKTVEDFHDVTLQCSDGVQIKANRCILALNSSLFQSMLLGNFEEGHSKFVKINFDSFIMQHVIDFCYGIKLDFDLTEANQKGTHDLVQLLVAADYLQLNQLLNIAIEEIYAFMRNFTQLVCFFLDETVDNESIAAVKKVQEYALQIIRKHGKECLFPAAKLMKKQSLEKVLQDEFILIAETSLYEVLKEWYAQNPLLTDAIELAKNIQFEKFGIKLFLEMEEEIKNFISKDRLLEIYKNIAQHKFVSPFRNAPIAIVKGASWLSGTYIATKIMNQTFFFENVNGKAFLFRKETHQGCTHWLICDSPDGSPCSRVLVSIDKSSEEEFEPPPDYLIPYYAGRQSDATLKIVFDLGDSVKSISVNSGKTLETKHAYGADQGEKRNVRQRLF